MKQLRAGGKIVEVGSARRKKMISKIRETAAARKRVTRAEFASLLARVETLEAKR